LLKSTVELFGTAGARTELDLLLMLGRPHKVHEILEDPDLIANKARLEMCSVPMANPRGVPDYHLFLALEWFRLCQALALGDYDTALRDLDACAFNYQEGEKRLLPRLQRSVSEMLGADIGGSARPFGSGYLVIVERRLHQELDDLHETFHLRRQLADVYALKGLFLLEKGPGASALPAFQQALDVPLFIEQGQKNTAGQQLARWYRNRIRDLTREDKP
jgi:hypothetical protein